MKTSESERYSKLPIREKSRELNSLHKAVLKLGKVFKSICDKYDIDYSICGGTLIGAARDGSFIYCDDDMDFAMTRSEYNRFRKVCSRDLPDGIRLVDWTEDPYFVTGIPQLVLENSLIIPEGEIFCSTCHLKRNIHIDIIVLDQLPEKKRDFLKRKRVLVPLQCLIQFHENPAWARLHLPSGKFWDKATEILCAAIPKKSLCRLANTIPQAFYKDKSRYMACWHHGNIKTMVHTSMPVDCMNELVTIDFEGIEFKVIRDWEKMLRVWFGEDWKVIPSPDRMYNHGFGKVFIDGKDIGYVNPLGKNFRKNKDTSWVPKRGKQ